MVGINIDIIPRIVWKKDPYLHYTRLDGYFHCAFWYKFIYITFFDSLFEAKDVTFLPRLETDKYSIAVEWLIFYFRMAR